MTILPSDADSNKATPTQAELDLGWDIGANCYGHSEMAEGLRDWVAQALAYQRVRYEAVAEQLEQHAAAHRARAFDYLARGLSAAANTETGTADGQRDAADRIRRVGGDK